ncbi:MAG: thiamine pyrophosphate-binding protein [Anaerolineales bacterium]|nr:thiamine pyrophosphate-binding protein [Anaerolineales bacterium]
MLGIEILLEILASTGVRTLFGNPGSTELPLNEALVTDLRFQYILGLHELPLTAMADGYAMASNSLGVVCVHISCGLGNAMGMLYNAYSAGTPLLLLAGQQDRRLRLGEPVLEGDTVSVAKPWTKWAYEVLRVEDMATAVRRAVQTALTPPTGPVFLSLPIDVQLENLDMPDVYPPSIPDRRVRPPLESLKKAVEKLVYAVNPVILAGSRVTESGAALELVRLAELLGAPVLAEQQTSHARLPMPADHPLYAGTLPLWSPDIRRKLELYDVIFAVGMNLLRLYIHHEPASPIPEHLYLIHLDANPREIAKNYPVDIGLMGDPKAGLAELSQLVSEIQSATQAQYAAKRLDRYAAGRLREREVFLAEIDAMKTRRPMPAQVFMGALASALPPDAAVVEEAATTHLGILEKLGAIKDAANYIAHRGWALGWGVGSAIGVKLAWPDRPVVALLGDGASLYGIQGLWTAAHYNIPVTFIIANNTQYKILKDSGKVMQLPRLAQHNFPNMDLVDPEVDFCGLARSLGVRARRVTEPDELVEIVKMSVNGSDPVLLDVTIER